MKYTLFKKTSKEYSDKGNHLENKMNVAIVGKI